MKPKTPNEYLAALAPEKRAALQKLHTAIRAAAPQAEECISYGVPAFRLHGKLLVAYAAAKKHCAFYPGAVVQRMQADLKNYDTSKGTIRFPPEKPLPIALVRKVIKRRLADHAN